jgi:TRAP-type transport system periplasmic protein
MRAAPLFLLAAGLLVPAAAPAQTVKLATLAPQGSIWHRILADQAADWKRVSDGRVELRVYPGGVAGDDPDMVRKMRVGQFHAAALTVVGLTQIDDAFRVFTVPFLFASEEELFFVLDRLEPLLRARLEAKGFVLLSWGYAGWARLYSKRPVRSAADLRSQKLMLWGGEERTMRMYRANGLQPVGLAATDIMMAMQTGMIEAFATTPLIILSMQWFRIVPYQLDNGLAPLIGATVMTRRAFDALPERDRAPLLAAGRRAGTRFLTEVAAEERRARTEIEARGVTSTRIAPEAAAEWARLVEAFTAHSRGQMVPPDVFDATLAAIGEYRRSR